MTHTNRNQNKVIIMEIKITRQKAIKDLVEGVLSIDGGPAMDTLENRCSCLKVGEYHAVMKKCKLYHERRIFILEKDKTGYPHDCEQCKKKALFYPNSALPKRCPMISEGNGVHRRFDGRIIVGKKAAIGLLVDTQATFDCVKERVLEELKEGKEVTIKITRKNEKRKRIVQLTSLVDELMS